MQKGLIGSEEKPKPKMLCNGNGEIFHLQSEMVFVTHPAKMDLNKKSGPKPRSVQTMLFDAQGFRKAIN